jgi:3-phenylpropionate/trans-cinnamate dioxygenase ferredoxin reductase subunit
MMPNHTYSYLIVGGGMTADSAVRGIREVDRSGPIGLIGLQPDPPYDRPPLSKGLWKGKPLEIIWRPSPTEGVTLHLGRTARTLDPRAKCVTDDQGSVYSFQKLLLATGGTPRRLPSGNDEIIYFRTLADYHRLRSLVERGQRFAVIGGGFIGSEIAAALAINGKQVTMIFPESGIGGRMFPSDLAGFLNDFYRQKGVEVLPGELVVDVQSRSGQSVVRTCNAQTHQEREIVADGVVAGLGIQPNVELAQAAGLEIDNGIRVDRSLRTSYRDIYAAGDVASFYVPVLDKRLRVEHEDNANTMGQWAGRALAGRALLYDHLPFFYSDLFELGYEAVGEVDSQLKTVADWKEPFRQGVVYYLRGGRVRGVLLWNVWEQVAAARRLIAEPGPFRPEDLKGRLSAWE